jgi:hypothetical protein
MLDCIAYGQRLCPVILMVQKCGYAGSRRRDDWFVCNTRPHKEEVWREKYVLLVTSINISYGVIRLYTVYWIVDFHYLFWERIAKPTGKKLREVLDTLWRLIDISFQNKIKLFKKILGKHALAFLSQKTYKKAVHFCLINVKRYWTVNLTINVALYATRSMFSPWPRL